jgi:uncharacterized protein (DUF1810 family)
MSDLYQLQRFVDAQEGVIEEVYRELREGEKVGHWMWFVFPQIKGLGGSYMANKFAISSLAEAKAYLEHPVLGRRLRECTRLVTAVRNRPIEQIFGYPDDLKFRSCMTLFAQATAENQVFREALGKYFGGEEDPLTLQRL